VLRRAQFREMIFWSLVVEMDLPSSGRFLRKRRKGCAGLNVTEALLQQQRGAIGEPEHRLRETAKKVISMGSVVSKLKQPMNERSPKHFLQATLGGNQIAHSNYLFQSRQSSRVMRGMTRRTIKQS